MTNTLNDDCSLRAPHLYTDEFKHDQTYKWALANQNQSA